MLTIAYLVNLYPAPSHTFIRREIAALEMRGVRIARFAHRAHSAELCDPRDAAERALTTVLTEASMPLVAWSILDALVRAPLGLARALGETARMTWRARKSGAAVHAGYFVLSLVLARHVRRLGIHHIHAHMATNAAAVAFLCSRIRGTTFSFTAHATYEMEAPVQRSLDRKIEAAAFVVAISEDGLRMLLEASPGARAKLHVVRCGLDSAWKTLPTAPPSKRTQFVCVARLDDHKHPELQIRALARLAELGERPQLRLIGDGPLREGLARLAQELGVAGQVKLEGWQPQERIQIILGESRAFVLSSRTEGLPIAIMEAFAAGRPVIATDVGGVRELVISGRTGWLVPPDDLPALAAAMLECLRASQETLEALSSAGRELVRTRHDVEQQAAQLHSLFEKATVPTIARDA